MREMWKDEEWKRGSSDERVLILFFTYTLFCICLNIKYIVAFRHQTNNNSVINMYCAIIASCYKLKPNKPQSELLIFGKIQLVALCTAHVHRVSLVL